MCIKSLKQKSKFLVYVFIQTHIRMKQEPYLLMETIFFFQLIFVVMLAWATCTKN